MKGLLLKDWYTLIKQMKIMLVLMLVFACVPGYSMAAFAVVYAAMLPVTANLMPLLAPVGGEMAGLERGDAAGDGACIRRAEQVG